MRVKGQNMHNSYQFTTSQNLSVYIFNNISCKTMKIDFKNSPKMEFRGFQTKNWNA